MNGAPSTARRRVLAALDIGPLWVRRRAREVESDGGDPADAAARRSIRIATLDWHPLREAVATCVACGLAPTRTQTVFGVGVDRPAWLIVGEAPGAEEDASGEPFVGPAGKLLDAMLASVGHARERDVFIANMVKCRPPGNRDPSPSELSACRPFLERQIALLQPRVVLVVGKVASAALLGHEGTMGSARGRVHRLSIDGRDIPAIATYHPSYLLRSAAEKAKAWADLCFARETYENLLPEAVR